MANELGTWRSRLLGTWAVTVGWCVGARLQFGCWLFFELACPSERGPWDVGGRHLVGARDNFWEPAVFTVSKEELWEFSEFPTSRRVGESPYLALLGTILIGIPI